MPLANKKVLDEVLDEEREQRCINRNVHDIRIENRSESMRRQTIRCTGFDGDITMETLADTFVIYTYVLYVYIICIYIICIYYMYYYILYVLYVVYCYCILLLLYFHMLYIV